VFRGVGPGALRGVRRFAGRGPGCIATGETEEVVGRLIREAIQLHLEGLEEDGLPIPELSSRVDYVEVKAP
jgi:predicted RNase H-like HicB family nuclease